MSFRQHQSQVALNEEQFSHDSHRNVCASQSAAVAVGADRSAVALELAACASDERQPGGTLRDAERPRHDVPRQNVHAIGVRRGVRGT